MKSISNLIKLLRSIKFNLKYLPFKVAIKLPIWVSTPLGEVRINKGQILLPIKDIMSRQIILGGGKSVGMNASRINIILAEDAKLIFMGSAIISEGTVLRIDKGSVIKIGDSFYCNANCFIRSTNTISFGNNCLLGWNVTISTSDGHSIWHNSRKSMLEAPVIIGNHVWLASYVKIGKNVNIPNDCVVAQASVVTKSFKEPNILIGGIPAKHIASNINWNKD